MFGASTIPLSGTPSQTHTGSTKDLRADTNRKVEGTNSRDAKGAAEDEAYETFRKCQAVWWNSTKTKKERCRIRQRMSRRDSKSKQNDPQKQEEGKAYEIYDAARKEWEDSYTIEQRTQIMNRARQRKVNRRGKARGSRKYASRDPEPSREDQMEDIVHLSMTTEDPGMGEDGQRLEEGSVDAVGNEPSNGPPIATNPGLHNWWGTVMSNQT
jgi:hypothetical protein